MDTPRASRGRARASLHSVSDVRERRSTLQPVEPVASQAAEPETTVSSKEVLWDLRTYSRIKMKGILLVAFMVLVAPPTYSRSAPADPEDSVVSIYTTPATGNKTGPLDVYQQIAYNVATRITSPIYRFFGFGANKTEDTSSPKKTWSKIELLDDSAENISKTDVKPLNTNALGVGRDVEELSEEAKKKADQKPEKITLYSNYLNWFDNIAAAQNAPVDRNDTINEVNDGDDDDITLDDVSVDNDKGKSREGGFVYFLELIGSWIQLIYGGLAAIFTPKSNSS